MLSAADGFCSWRHKELDGNLLVSIQCLHYFPPPYELEALFVLRKCPIVSQEIDD